MHLGFISNHGFFIVLLFAFVMATVILAQSAQEVVITFVNGASPVNNVTLFVFFPDRVVPVNLSPGMIWDAVTKTLTVAVNKVESYQKVSLAVSIEGPAGSYKIPSKLRGQWTQIGRDFESDLLTLETTIQGARGGSIVEILRSNPQVVAVTQNVAVPVAVALEVAGTGALVSAAVSSNASLAVQIAEALRFFQFLGFSSFRIKRTKPWGKIYNQITRKEIKNATVRVFESTFQKLKDTQFTDAGGRFGFLISPGTYYLVISKEGFQDFKSNIITVKGGEEAFNIEIPLIPEISAIVAVKPLVKFWASFVKIINILNPWILTLGTVASLGILLILPTIFNIIVLLIYLALDIAKIILSRKVLNSFGRVISSINQQPLALSVVRIFDADHNWLLTSRVTDSYGRFKFLVTPGNYYITCAKEGYKPYTSQSLELSRASVISWDITLEPAA